MLDDRNDARSEIAAANKSVKELHEKGAHAEALALANRTVEFAQKRLGDWHPLTIVSLGNQAVELKWLGHLEEAKGVYEKLLAFHKTTSTEDGELYARTLNNLAELHVDCGDDSRAEAFQQEAVAILERVLPADDPAIADSLSNLAQIYGRAGKTADAEVLLRRAVDIAARTDGTDHFVYGLRLGNLAAVLHNKGQHAEAMRLLREALRIIYDRMGRMHPLFADTLCKVAALYRTVGDLAEAERLYREALDIQLASVGRTPRAAVTMELLAALHTEKGKSKEAETLLAQAQGIRVQVGQPDIPVSVLLKEAHLLASGGDLDTAEVLFRRVAAIEESFGENYPPLASTLNNLAQTLKTKGDYAEAEGLYRRALAIQLLASGAEHANRAAILHNLAMLYAATDRSAEAVRLMREAEIINELEIDQIFSLTSERQRIDHLEDVADRTGCLLSLVSENCSQDPEAVRSAFDLLLRRKGIGAESMARQRAAALQSGLPDLDAKLREITTLKRDIAREAWSIVAAENLREQRQRVANSRARLEQLEMEIGQEVPGSDLAMLTHRADTNAIACALPKGSVLIEFAEFHSVDFKFRHSQTKSARGPAHYVAFTLPAGLPEHLQMFDLGERWPVDQLIAKYRRFLSEDNDSEAGVRPRMKQWPTGEPALKLGDNLRRLILDRLHPAICTSTRWLVAPVGDLTRLPFQTLPIGGDQYLTDAYNIGYLSAGRDVLRLRTLSRSNSNESVVIADPDFDLKLGENGARKDWKNSGRGLLALLRRAAARLSQTREEGERDSVPRSMGQSGTPDSVERGSPGAYSRDLRSGSFRFSRLPGTRVEGQRIGELLGVSPWFGAAALKGRLRECRQPRVLHVATHGFFLADQSDARIRPGATHTTTGDQVGFVQGPGMENPLIRSGFALAGANAALGGCSLSPSAENGIVTAAELAELNLSGTELITLSDCDTGLGELHAGEGVFGFRRACVAAGARTLVLSLWKLPDFSSAVLMVKFYENLRDGYGRCDGLLAAQDYVRGVTIDELRESWLTPEVIDQLAGGDEGEKTDLIEDYVDRPGDFRPFSHPRYWGAFICEGDHGPMTSAIETQEKPIRVPGAVWSMTVAQEMAPQNEVVQPTLRPPVFRLVEPTESFELPPHVNTDIGLVVAPDCRHVACGVRDGRGMHVELNGRSLPSHDSVFGVYLANEALAYGASRLGRRFVVFNEQEQGTWDDIGRSSPVVSPDSRRVAYSAQRGNGWYVVVDGGVVGGPYEGLAPGGILFSPDSRRFAYVIKHGPAWLAVVDGREGEAFPSIAVRSLTFSPDSNKLAYVAFVRGKWLGNSFRGNVAPVVNGAIQRIWDLDEVSGQSGLAGELCFSPDSTRLAYSGVQRGKSFVVVDETVFGEYDAVTSGWRTRADGKPLMYHWERHSTIVFSPNSKKVAYTARRGGESFAAVIGGEERRFRHESILNRPPLFSPDSERFAYGVEQYLEQGVAIDGTVRWAHSGLPPAPWSFSPDSSILAYISWDGKSSTQCLSLSGQPLDLPGGLLANSSVVWDGCDRLHFIASDGQRVWVQHVSSGAD
ncbi:MAG: CHAT domain-containing protein [Acidobacteria bacterium]|nr:CHAT domain-containing protein [Acidobacteriota bacterium]